MASRKKRRRRGAEGSDGAWRSRIVDHGEAVPSDLIANPRNWRTHPQAQKDALAGALDEVGWVQDVIVNRRTGHLIDGHLRVALAHERGEIVVPVVYVDLDEHEEALILATLDPLAAMAEVDQEVLAALVADVDPESDALKKVLEALMGATPRVGRTDPDDAPGVPDAADMYVKRGQLYALGEHRLLCGDATDAGDVSLLLGEERPLLTITDPPYGVDYDPSWRPEVLLPGDYSLGEVTNDERADWGEAWALSPSDIFYVWHSGVHGALVAASLTRQDIEIRNQVIWNKQMILISRGHYNWKHEPCYYAVRKGATAHWIGPSNEPTVWDIRNRAGVLKKATVGTADEGTVLSTQKPIECMERPMRNHEGDVYDPFVGAGTTIIAAERLSRRCYAMDIESRYVQIAIDRWEQFTGQVAERLDS